MLSGFGLIYAGFYYLIFQVIFPRLLNAGAWTVGKEILISLIIFVSAGIINWGYALITALFDARSEDSDPEVLYKHKALLAYCKCENEK